MKSVRVALCGAAGSGKSAVAQELCTHAFSNAGVVLSFATPMRRIFNEIFLRPLNKGNRRDREFMQQFGTGLVRRFDKDVWVRYMSESVTHNSDCAAIFVDDMRFLNEADWLRKHGFVLVRVVGRKIVLRGDCMRHQSELEQRQIAVDFEIDNHGTIKQTVNQLITQLARMGKWIIE